MRRIRDSVNVCPVHAVRHGRQQLAEDVPPLRRRGNANLHLTIKSPGPPQRRVERVRPVGRRQDDNSA